MAIRIGRLRIENGKAFLIYMILLSAFLNPVLRPSAESNITLFRLLLPLAIILIALTSRRLFLSFLVCIIAFTGFSVLQHFLTSHFFYPAVSFSLRYLAIYLFHYISLVTIFFLVFSLYLLENNEFTGHLFTFLRIFAKCLCVFLLIFTVILHRSVSEIPMADNINNLSCILCASVCTFIDEARKKGFFHFAAWMFLLAFVLYFNDAKAALFGLFAEIMLFFSTFICGWMKGKSGLFIRVAIILIVVLGVVILLIFSPAINEYSIRNLIAEPIMRVATHDLYHAANTSITYRTNSTITAFEIIQNTTGVGVGAGNTSRVLKAVMTNVYPTWAENTGYSLHNWWLELITDFGYPVLIVELLIFLSEAVRYCLRIQLSHIDVITMVFFLSFPIWSIAASGLLTEYYTLSVLSFALLIRYKQLFKWKVPS